MGFYEGLFFGIDKTVFAAINTNIAKVMSFMSPIFHSMMLIYLAWIGVQMIMGWSNTSIPTLIQQNLKMVVVYTLALNTGVYNDIIVKFLYFGPEQVAQIFAGVDTSALDGVLTKGFAVAGKAWNKAGLTDFGLIFVALFICVGTVAASAYAAFLLIMAKIFIAVLVALGPIFICLILFNSTKRFFESWLAQVLNSFMIIVLVFAVMILFMNVYLAFITDMQPDAIFSLMAVGKFVILSLIFVLTLRQIPAVASALAGGTQISTGGVLGAMAYAARYMRPSGLQKIAGGVRNDARVLGGVGRTVGGAMNRLTQMTPSPLYMKKPIG
jgi:type IV secretion system protein VirB6